MNTPNNTPPGSTGSTDSSRLNPRVSWLYGFGQAAEGIKNNAMLVFLLPFYTLELNLNPVLAGMALGVAVLFDAVSDPVAGWLSDHLKSPWKRRHPFLYSSILPLVISYYFLWLPPDVLVATSHEPGFLNLPNLFWWLLAFAVLVRFSMTLYHVPHLSLNAELTENYDERTRLTGLRLFFSWTAGVLAYTLALYFTTPEGSTTYDLTLYPNFATYAALTMGAIILISALGTHSEIPRLHMPPERGMSSPLALFKDIYHVLQKRNVASLVLSAFFGVLAFRVTQAMVLPLYLYFWEFTSTEMIALGLTVIPATICASMLAQYSSRKLDKREALITIGVAFSLVVPILITLRLIEVLPENGTTLLFALVCLAVFINSSLGIATNILQNSMMADTTDEYELETGERREGLFYSMNAFIGKTGSACGAIVAGLALQVVALPANAQPGEVAWDKLFSLAMFEGPLAGVIKLIAVLCILGYTLNRSRHHQILETLKKRREPQPPSTPQ
ncbi:MAG: MFS transporter [Gammaproteobacteria bacterium]